MRVGAKGEGKWRRVSWDEALEYIAEKMQKIKAEHGAEAVAFGRGTGINNTHIVSRLANLFGTPNVTAIAYFCYGPRVAVSKVTASGNFSQKGLGHDAHCRTFTASPPASCNGARRSAPATITA